MSTYIIYGLEVANMDGTSIGSLYMFEPSNWAHVDTNIAANGDRESLYQFTGSDPEYPVTIRKGVYPKVNSEGKKVFNVSCRFSSFIEKTDGSDVTVEPFTCVTAWTSPWAPVLDSYYVQRSISNILSWFSYSSSTGAFLAADLDDLKHSLVEIDLAGITRT